MADAKVQEQILEAVKNVQEKKTEDVWIRPFGSVSDKDAHQFVFFFKPELTSVKAVKFPAVLAQTVEILEKFKVKIASIRVLSGDYLLKNDIMIQHYGVIANISKYGRPVISAAAEKTLNEKFGDLLAGGAEVLGGHQFLERFPELNAYSLSILNDNLGTTRLAGGTYAMVIKMFGKQFIVLNPFHAYQLVPYTSSGQSIVVFECLSSPSDLSWADLRNNVCGVTEPKDAKAGSVRRTYLEKKEEFGLPEVGKSANGVHMSAGPLEALAELQRFFSIAKPQETNFGGALKAAGNSDDQLEILRKNPLLERDGGKKVSAFDVTEEKDSAQAVKDLTGFKVAEQ